MRIYEQEQKVNIKMEEHVLDLLPAYSLGSLDPQENELVIRHLSSCELCRQELESYNLVAGKLAYAAAPVEPPDSLKQRILTHVEAGSQRASAAAHPRPLKGLFSQLFSWKAAALVAVILLAASNLFLWRQVSNLREAPPLFQTVALTGSEGFNQSSGILVISQEGKFGTLVVDDLPVLDESHDYQLWLIDQNGNRTSGGIFDVSQAGYGSLEIWSRQPLVSYPAFGVTIEPTGGSPQPTGERVLSGNF